MIIREINIEEFDNFSKNHILKNFYQTKEYGNLMKNSDFSVMYIGAFKDETLVAASLIMHKSLGANIRYGYAPRGFLIDYYNRDLLESFTKKIKEFFFKKGFAFIKINPEITYSKLDFDNKSKTINTNNREIINNLKELGYDKLRDNLYFESLLPKYTPVIFLPNYDFNLLDKSILDKIEENELSGIKLIKGNKDDIETFYKFIDHKENKTLTYYKFLYDSFIKEDMVDLLLCEVDYQTYVKYLQKQYVNEQEVNERINFEFHKNPNNEDLYNRKTRSDQLLADISSQISLYNRNSGEENTKIIGSALVIRNQGRATIISTGHSKKYDNIDVKTFIYYKIIELYKKAGYNFLDLNGITADFTDSNPYKELNKFKLKFKPEVFEFIGEFDLIVNKPLHQILWSTNKIQKEFYKPAIKK